MWNRIEQCLDSNLETALGRRRLLWRVLSTAAVILLVGGIVTLWRMQAPSAEKAALARIEVNQYANVNLWMDGTHLELGRNCRISSQAAGQRILIANDLAKPISMESHGGVLTVAVPKGCRATLRLADGSEVKMRGGSKFSYAFPNNNKVSRTAYVAGDAFFDVAHDVAHPFLVMGPGLRVTVLGTAFEVNDYDRAAGSRVTVLRGRVAVKQQQAKCPDVMLGAGEEGQFGRQGTRVTKVDAAAKLIWATGELNFDEEPLRQIVRQLEDVYNVQIEVSDAELLSHRIYGRFSASTDKLEDVLTILSATGHFSYSVRGNKVVIAK